MNINLNNNLKIKNLNSIYKELSSNSSIAIEQLDFDLNYVDEHGYSLILLASIDGDLELIKKLLNQTGVIYTDCCQRLKANSDPLHMAIKFQHYDIVSYLVEERKVLINNYDAYSCTPLYYAIGDCDLFSYLIAKGSNFNSIKGNPFKLAVNSLNIEFINCILPYLNERNDLLSYCPFVDLAYSYTYGTDLTRKLKLFDYLLKHPKIKLRQIGQTDQSLTNVIKFNKFRFFKLLILNNYDIDKFDLSSFLIANLRNSSYCDKLLVVFKLNYYLGFKLQVTNFVQANVQAIEQFNYFNLENFYFGNSNFGNSNSNSNQDLISINNTQIYQNYVKNWKSRKPNILNLQQLARIYLRKHFNKNLIHILNTINYPRYLINYLNLHDLQDYLDVLDYA